MWRWRHCSEKDLDPENRRGIRRDPAVMYRPVAQTSDMTARDGFQSRTCITGTLVLRDLHTIVEFQSFLSPMLKQTVYESCEAVAHFVRRGYAWAVLVSGSVFASLD